MNSKVKYGLLEIGSMEQVRDYWCIEDVFKDIVWKDPSSFWIGDVEEGRAYTIEQFLERNKESYKLFCEVIGE